MSGISPGIIYSISNSYDVSKFSNITLQKNVLYTTNRLYDLDGQLVVGNNITCFTDYSEKAFISALAPYSMINDSLGGAGMALAIISGVFLLASIGMIGLFFLCNWLYKT